MHAALPPSRIVSTVARTTILLLAVTASALAAENPVATLPPHDEGGEDPSFSEFRKRLTKIIADRDASALAEVVAEDIHMSFGGQSGRKTFFRKWQPGNADSSLWRELGTILEMGGSFYGTGPDRRFCAPYVFSEFPDELEPFSHQVVTRSGVAVRSQPDSRASVTRTLDHAVIRTRPGKLRTVTDASGIRWVEIRIGEGIGYIREKAVRSPVAYRACFDRTKEGWRMTAFIAGD